MPCSFTSALNCASTLIFMTPTPCLEFRCLLKKLAYHQWPLGQNLLVFTFRGLPLKRKVAATAPTSPIHIVLQCNTPILRPSAYSSAPRLVLVPCGHTLLPHSCASLQSPAFQLATSAHHNTNPALRFALGFHPLTSLFTLNPLHWLSSTDLHFDPPFTCR